MLLAMRCDRNRLSLLLSLNNSNLDRALSDLNAAVEAYSLLGHVSAACRTCVHSGNAANKVHTEKENMLKRSGLQALLNCLGLRAVSLLPFTCF